MTATGLTVGSLFTGIGGLDKGLEDAGWEVRWQIEIDEFCNRVLERHWPDVKRYRDVRAVDPGGLERVDLICGGSPCQDVSVAGKREGLAGGRSSLFWEVVRIAGAIRPRWLLIENVQGLFSSNAGRDFLTVLSSLDELGYGLAWRVLDSQHFGVPQRRRRIYLVGYLGAPCPPEVLFEPESVRGDTAAGRGKGADIAYALAASAGVHIKSGWNTAYPLTTRSPIRGSPERSDTTLVVSGTVTGSEAHNGYSGVRADYDTLVGAPADPDGVRETPGPAGRLDSARYRALGNAVTVNVARWIGERMRRATEE